MDYDEDDKNLNSLWVRIKFYIFMKLACNLWQYVIFHHDYWKKPYGITFTENRDFFKKLKYDLVDVDDDLEVEMKKQN